MTLWERILDAIADRVVEKQRAAPANDHVETYYDARSAPCGPRAFLTAARAGAFDSFRRGRRVLARRADVERWIEAQPRPIKASTEPGLDDATLLGRAGIQRRGMR